MKLINTKYLNIIYVIVIAIISIRCANIVAPEGGPRDITPPVPVKFEPPQNSVNFSENSFRIWFDEFVRLKDATNKMLISPPVSEKPEATARGKSIIVQLNQNFKPNTTYNISFGSSIIDITEANTLPDFQYVFSTGDFIDSLSLTGKVIDAFTLEPIKDVSVFLYKDNVDSLPLIVMPDFIAKSNDAGFFTFNNIPSGKFKIFALNDGNNNYLYDLPNEKIAFSDTLLSSYFIHKNIKKDSLQPDTSNSLMSKIKPIELYAFTEVDSSQKLLKYNSAGIGLVKFIYKSPVRNFKFTPLNPLWNNDTYIIEPNFKGDTIQIWYSDVEADSLSAILSCRGIKDDTVVLRLITEKTQSMTTKRRGADTEPEKLYVSFSASSTNPIDLNENFKIYFSRPIISYNYDKLFFIDNTDTIKPIIFFADSSKRTLEIEYKWEEENDYKVFIEPGTFTDIQGYYNDTIIVNFKSKSKNDYGVFLFKPKNIPVKKQIIFQLLNQKNQIIKEFIANNNETISIEFLHPSDYKLKAIIDENKNGRWDAGNYNKKISPDKVLLYKQPIKIKGGWETEIEWEL